MTAAQAFADIAAVAILEHRAVADAQTINAQLTAALNSRLVIEQAKPIVTERAGVPMEQACALLRSHGRDRNLPRRRGPQRHRRSTRTRPDQPPGTEAELIVRCRRASVDPRTKGRVSASGSS